MNNKLFTKTKNKLIFLYTSIVGVVFLFFSIFIYQYFYDFTYNDIDRSLNDQLHKIVIDLNLFNIRSLVLNKGGLQDQMVYIWEGEELIFESPREIAKEIRPYELSKDISNGISSYSYKDYHFRQIKNTVNEYSIEIIKVVNTEVLMLTNLRNIMFFFTIIGLIVVYLIGKFLTKKALEPIEASWENQVLFIQDASHELRTPLTIVFTKLQNIIKNQDQSVSSQMPNIVIIMKEIRRLRKLVSDLLKLTKEDGVVELNYQNEDIGSIFSEIISEYEEIIEFQNKRFEFSNELKNQTINIDKEKLKQLIVIFVDNSIKYTDENDLIEIKLLDENQNIKIQIKDSGIGIKEEELEFIFNRFFRSSNERKNNSDGFGIGLSIASILISNLNGKISVSSKENEGSIFSIILPKNLKKH
ncbi:MAG: HAMP domain-containing sensor histidine kinase [Peptostreptococcaceae bacterium]